METCINGISDIIICADHYSTQIKESSISGFSKSLLRQMVKNHFNGGHSVPITENDFKSFLTEVRVVVINKKPHKAV